MKAMPLVANAAAAADIATIANAARASWRARRIMSSERARERGGLCLTSLLEHPCEPHVVVGQRRRQDVDGDRALAVADLNDVDAAVAQRHQRRNDEPIAVGRPFGL